MIYRTKKHKYIAGLLSISILVVFMSCNPAPINQVSPSEKKKGTESSKISENLDNIDESNKFIPDLGDLFEGVCIGSCPPPPSLPSPPKCEGMVNDCINDAIDTTCKKVPLLCKTPKDRDRSICESIFEEASKSIPVDSLAVGEHQTDYNQTCSEAVDFLHGASNLTWEEVKELLDSGAAQAYFYEKPGVLYKKRGVTVPNFSFELNKEATDVMVFMLENGLDPETYFGIIGTMTSNAVNGAAEAATKVLSATSKVAKVAKILGAFGHALTAVQYSLKLVAQKMNKISRGKGIILTFKNIDFSKFVVGLPCGDAPSFGFNIPVLQQRPVARDFAKDINFDDLPEAPTPEDGILKFHDFDGQVFTAGKEIGRGFDVIRYFTEGDWTGDGVPDLVTLNAQNQLTLYPFNKDTQTLATTGQLLGENFGAENYSHYFPGDWNGDGKYDLVVRDHQENLKLFTSNGQTLSTPANIGTEFKFTHYFPGDWDGDGKTDLMVRKSDKSLTLYPFDGEKFTASKAVGVGWNFNHYFPGDWNGDGKHDMMVRDCVGKLKYYPFDGNIFVAPAGKEVGVGFEFESYYPGDWDGDGDFDLAVVNKALELRLYKWDSNALKFTDSGELISPGTSELNEADQLFPAPWKGQGTFSIISRKGISPDRTPVLPPTRPDDVIDDLLVRDNSGNLQLYPWNITGFEPPKQVGNGWNFTHYFQGNWTGNGTSDLVVRDSAGNLHLYPFKDGVFEAAKIIGNGWNFTHYFPGNWTGNGTLDLLVRDSSGNLLLYPFNNGAFEGSKQVGNGWDFTHYFPGNWADNGTDDLLVRDSSGNLLLYPFNNGAFEGSKQVGNGWDFTHYFPGNWADNKTDDLVVRDSMGNLTLYPFNNRAFEGSKLIGTGWNFATYLPGDWSGNGTLDMVGRDESGSLLLYPFNGEAFEGARLIGTGWNFSHYFVNKWQR